MGKKTIVTHEGKFHADDVFAVATLLLALQDEAEVRRTRDEEDVASADIAVDVGGIYDAEKNRFDHHQ
ncbi:MAG: MYG1 family protein, partial [bacterium]|nr:MYG1 family protein [bacterium]